MLDTENIIIEPESDKSSVLRTEGLVKRYGKRTVANGVSINVRQGEIVGLLGPNGAGKTTSFYMTTGLVVPKRRTRLYRRAGNHQLSCLQACQGWHRLLAAGGKRIPKDERRRQYYERVGDDEAHQAAAHRKDGEPYQGVPLGESTQKLGDRLREVNDADAK